MIVKRPLTVAKLFLFILLIPFLVSFLPFVLGLVGFNYIYSEGDRVGQIIKFSHKGLIWKTDEAGMGLTQSGAYIGYWDFSVDSQDPNKNALLKALESARDTGDLVKVHYIQHGGALYWRGKTPYLANSVTVIRARHQQ